MKRLSYILVVIAVLLTCVAGYAAEEYTAFERIKTPSDLSDGGRVVLVMSSITPNGMKSGSYALKTVEKENGVLDFSEFSQDMDISDAVWIMSPQENGYCLMASGGKNDGKYLSLSDGSLEFSDEPCVFNVSGENDLSFTCSGLRLRFTNSAGNGVSGFTLGTKEASSVFSIYTVETKVREEEEEVVKLPDPVTEPLITFACISDLHVDYGIESWDPPIRTGTVKTCEELRKEGIDLLLVGGDITSSNASVPWTKELFGKVKETVSSVLRSASGSGRVLYATGNHEFVAGGKDFNSGDYSDIMLGDVGEFVNAYYLDSDKTCLLAYHYVISGFHFVVINTPYTGEDNHGSYIYTEGTIAWLEKELDAIGAEKTVFVMGHYPLRDSNGISSPGKGVSDKNGLNDKLKAVLLKNPNCIYLYGHDHGGRSIDIDIFERLTPYRADGSPITKKKIAPKSFISCFGGSMSYYSGSLSSAQPDIVQALLIKAYDDRVVFEMKNYGSKTGSFEVPKSYTSARTVEKDSFYYEPVGMDERLSEDDYDVSTGEFKKEFVFAKGVYVEESVENALDDPYTDEAGRLWIITGASALILAAGLVAALVAYKKRKG